MKTEITPEEYSQAESILLSKEVKYWDWLRMKGTTPDPYNAIIEAMVEFADERCNNCGAVKQYRV
jgi:hypothetical protein